MGFLDSLTTAHQCLLILRASAPGHWPSWLPLPPSAPSRAAATTAATTTTHLLQQSTLRSSSGNGGWRYVVSFTTPDPCSPSSSPPPPAGLFVCSHADSSSSGRLTASARLDIFHTSRALQSPQNSTTLPSLAPPLTRPCPTALVHGLGPGPSVRPRVVRRRCAGSTSGPVSTHTAAGRAWSTAATFPLRPWTTPWLWHRCRRLLPSSAAGRQRRRRSCSGHA